MIVYDVAHQLGMLSGPSSSYILQLDDEDRLGLLITRVHE